MFAIVEFKGMQFQAREGALQNLPYFECKVGDKVVFDKILLLNDGKEIKLNEEIKDAKVEAEVLSKGQTGKVGVVKFHSKKHYQKIGAHRQDFIRVKINKLSSK